jgi:hypothetical protein
MNVINDTLLQTLTIHFFHNNKLSLRNKSTMPAYMAPVIYFSDEELNLFWYSLNGITFSSWSHLSSTCFGCKEEKISWKNR